jgi:hypothetical protein
LAVRFARSYLADPSREAMAPFLAQGIRFGSGKAPTTNTAAVAQAEVSETEDLGDGESILTVACELRDARTLYLAVPIARSAAGEVAALGAPSIVAGPGTAAGAEAGGPQSLAGPDASGIEGLVSKFIPDYLSAEGAADLSYLLAPGAVIQPLRGEVSFDSITAVDQLGDRCRDPEARPGRLHLPGWGEPRVPRRQGALRPLPPRTSAPLAGTST